MFTTTGNQEKEGLSKLSYKPPLVEIVGDSHSKYMILSFALFEVSALLSKIRAPNLNFVCLPHLHSTKLFTLERFNGKGHLKRFCYSQYEVKVYDKGKQYGLTYDVLRFEKKLKKMEGFGYIKLDDLTSHEIIKRASNTLLETAKVLIVSEPYINKNALCSTGQTLIILKV